MNIFSSQNSKIIFDLLEGAHITSLDALNDYGCFRLASRICDLKKRGYKIKSKKIKTINNKWVSEYYYNFQDAKYD